MASIEDAVPCRADAMPPIFDFSSADVARLLAALILMVVFFLIARVGRVRQPIALAFAMMPLLLTWAIMGVIQA